MEINIYQIDAFAETLFTGNPAAVCPLKHWLSDEQLQAIALENNLSETAFFVENEYPFHIRWFTPTTEVELCGHATLAAAHVLRKHFNHQRSPILFNSQSGLLKVTSQGDDRYTLDFPADSIREVATDLHWKQYFNQPILEACRGATDYIFRVESEGAVRDMIVDYERLIDADGRGFIVTAEGSNCDYVARCFYPQAGVNEDAATGSSHTTLAPFWADKFGKKQFSAKQLSKRGGSFNSEIVNDRVLISGKAISYMKGVIEL